MAAYLAGVRTILIPKENEADMEEIAQVVRDNVKIIPVSSADEVLHIALAEDPFDREESEVSPVGDEHKNELIPINTAHNPEMSCSVR